MLGKRYRNFLDSVASLNPDISFHSGYSFDRICEKTGLSHSEAVSIARYLSRREYVQILYINDEYPSGIVLLEKGRFPREFSRRDAVTFLLTHIGLPIGVSIATTLITLWLNGLLPS